MELAHKGHGDTDHRTSGKLVGHGRYELFAAVFFGGCRRRVFTQLAAQAAPGRETGCSTSAAAAGTSPA
jgi:hypothetical protein